jgi:hypothetical protein
MADRSEKSASASGSQKERAVVVSRVVDAFDKKATGVSALQHSHNIVWPRLLSDTDPGILLNDHVERKP